MEEKKLDELLKVTKSIHTKVDHMGQRMDRMEQRMDHIEQKMDHMEQRMDHMEQGVDHLAERIEQVNDISEGKIVQINSHLERHDAAIRDIKLTLENVTNRNISIIAENHIELLRKLNESQKVKDEEEKLYLRVNILENDVRRLKEKTGIA